MSLSLGSSQSCTKWYSFRDSRGTHTWYGWSLLSCSDIGRSFLILVSNNPQTFHQALLLMANLARLAPDSVLHHVMPVFTFMGSNVFHRDDTYSFKVVQQVHLSPCDSELALIDFVL